jgi:hypothetical protein
MSHADDERPDRVPRDDDRAAPAARQRGGRRDEPDVLFDVSDLRVDEISLDVEDLRARVSLDADVLALLKLHVGVDATLDRVQLQIKGVEASALLKVRLDNVARILDRVLTTIDNNPDIVERLTEQAGAAVDELEAAAGQPVRDLETGAGAAIESVGAAVDDVGRGARRAVEDVGEEDEVAEETRRRRPRPREPERRPRRRPPDSTGKRPTKGSRTSRERPSEER